VHIPTATDRDVANMQNIANFKETVVSWWPSIVRSMTGQLGSSV
jgi:hypothetical protein